MEFLYYFVGKLYFDQEVPLPAVLSFAKNFGVLQLGLTSRLLGAVLPMLLVIASFTVKD
jgi:hypothetical protein